MSIAMQWSAPEETAVYQALGPHGSTKERIQKLKSVKVLSLNIEALEVNIKRSSQNLRLKPLR